MSDVCIDAGRSQSGRMTIQEIAQRLNIGRLALYKMLGECIIPGIRLGKRWIVTGHSYLEWERRAGQRRF